MVGWREDSRQAYWELLEEDMLSREGTSSVLL